MDDVVVKLRFINKQEKRDIYRPTVVRACLQVHEAAIALRVNTAGCAASLIPLLQAAV